jgi:hypothetical protein
MAESDQPNTPGTDALICAGLLGLVVTATFHLLDKPDLDLPRLVAVYSFALAAPLLSAGLIADYGRRAGRVIPKWCDLAIVLGVVLAVVGFGGLIFHFGAMPGATFVVGVSVCLILARLIR